MSTVTARAPLTTATPRRGWSLRTLYRAWRKRRKAQAVFVAILHAADIYPPG